MLFSAFELLVLYNSQEFGILFRRKNLFQGFFPLVVKFFPVFSGQIIISVVDIMRIIE